MSRRDARRHAFTLVFQLPFHKDGTVEALAEAKKWYYDDLDSLDKSRPKGKNAEYVDRVVWGVYDRQAQIDGVIENFLRDWDLDRINKVDLAIMRLSIYEMLCEPDVPLGTAVNEAVEIAKEFGTDDSPSFINGVLGNVSRSIQAQGRGLDA
ncbi:MAG: transcription antitermination factor NusB [Firmicutes bacterium]|nr:transcription antitermination factor NusB [Bacillota bacterium]